MEFVNFQTQKPECFVYVQLLKIYFIFRYKYEKDANITFFLFGNIHTKNTLNVQTAAKYKKLPPPLLRPRPIL
jgi:hypothetical protein